MGLAIVRSWSPGYVHHATCRRRGVRFSLFSASPILSVVLFSYFACFSQPPHFSVSSSLSFYPTAVAIAADTGQPAPTRCEDSSNGKTSHPSCSASPLVFGSYGASPSSAVLCEDDVNGLPEYYAVVVDSGSTGTRAFVYKVRVEPDTCGDAQLFPQDGNSKGTSEEEPAESVFAPLGRAIVEVPAVATRRIGPGIALFAKRESGRRNTSEDQLGIENMTEESMRRELLDDEHLIVQKEKAEEQARQERQRLATPKEAAGARAAAGAAQERFGRHEDVEESLEKYLGELRDFVWETVPAAAREEQRAFLFFRGTAGMRALPLDQQQKLLERVKASLSTWGLLLPAGEAGASVLSGAEEGVLGWVALNQLLGNFERSDVLLSFAAGHHRFCSSEQQQQQQQDERQKEKGRKEQKRAQEQSPIDDSGSEENDSQTSTVSSRGGLIEMGGASAQVVFQLPLEARAANLLSDPFLSSPSPAGGDPAAAEGSPSSKRRAGLHQQQQPRRQQQHRETALRAVEPSERLFHKEETRQYPPVRRHRGPYAAEDFFEVDLCSSRHIVYSKSFLGFGRQHALMQHIHDSVSEAMEERKQQMERGEGPPPIRDFPVEAAVPCLPADVRVHVSASPAAATAAAFDEDLSKMVQEEQHDIEEHVAAEQRRQQQGRRLSQRSGRTTPPKKPKRSIEGETTREGEEPHDAAAERRSVASGFFAAAGAAILGDSTETPDSTDNEEEEESEEEESEGGETNVATWRKLPRAGVAEEIGNDEVLQVLFKKKETRLLQQIKTVAAQGTSDGTACMLKMAQTMGRVGRLPFEVHRDMQLYATENFYHFNEYVLQAKGKPHFTVDIFSREGRKLCFLQQVEEVHRRLHPRAAREKAETACFGLVFMSEFLRRVIGLERDRVLLAVNDLHDVEISWTAAVPMLYMPHLLLRHQRADRRPPAAAAEAAAAAAATPASVFTGGDGLKKEEGRLGNEEGKSQQAGQSFVQSLKTSHEEEL